MREAEAMALLVSAKGVSYGRREMALRAAGSALAVVQNPGAYAAQLSDEGAAAVRRNARDAERYLERLRRDGVHLIVRGGEGYPERLMQAARPPQLLFCWGKADLCDPFPLAIVGTRGASSYGLRHTRAIARELAGAGMCVISGLAVGIDAAGHMGALDAGGRTVAVLGGALDRFYPAENRALMRQILDMGGSVVTEYPMGVPPSRYSFLERNRIVAGLALGVLVTEGPRRSGALRTAQDALDEGREVFALPGNVDSEGSQLPNRLIAEGAHLVTCAQDILDMLVIEPQVGMTNAAGIPGSREAPGRSGEKASGDARRKSAPRLPPDLGEQERAVLQALACGDQDFDAICAATAISSGELGTLLMMMELDGYIEALAGCRYALSREMRA